MPQAVTDQSRAKQAYGGVLVGVPATKAVLQDDKLCPDKSSIGSSVAVEYLASLCVEGIRPPTPYQDLLLPLISYT